MTSFFEMAEHPLATACVDGFDSAVHEMTSDKAMK